MKSIFLIVILAPFYVFGEAYPVQATPKDNISAAKTLRSERVIEPARISSPNSKQASIEMNAEQLLNRPALLKRAMQSVLAAHNVVQIELILPIYKKLPDADSLLISYANALIAHGNGNYGQAVDTYRAIISQKPKLTAVRFDLATALYHDRQYDAALDQFRKLQGEDLPEHVIVSIDKGINAINRQEDWRFYISGFHQHDDNINDVPSDSKIAFANGTLTFPGAESAQGFHVDAGVSKRFNLSDNFYSAFRLGTTGDIYWDNHDYDDITLRTSLAIGYQNAKYNNELAPFVKKRYFGGESYSSSFGAKWSVGYQFMPRWHLFSSNELGYESFKKAKHLDGYRQSNNLSVAYVASSTQSWSAGLNYYHNQARDAEDTYSLKGVYVGWQQEWDYGISSKVNLSANQRENEGVDFFNIQRKDKSYGANFSFWKRDWHWKGLTPRLTVDWSKTDSNHFYYDNKEDTDVYIEISKEF